MTTVRHSDLIEGKTTGILLVGFKTAQPSAIMKSIRILVALFLLPPALAKADAVNENRILRKAGGESKGSITLTISVIQYLGGVPSLPSTTTETRTGDVHIPTKEGKAKSIADHLSAPGPTLDSTTEGKVKKADVARNGKSIKYSGNGTAGAVLDSDGDYTGSAKGVSKIRGSKVVSTCTMKGSRTVIDEITLDVDSVTTVSGTGKGTGKF